VALLARAQEAHQIVNDLGAVLRYLCFSTMVEPDVMVYPDSGKVGIFDGAAPGGSKEKRTFSKFLREEAESATTRVKSSGAYARRIPVSEEYKQKEATATRFRLLAGPPRS
jgi:hypothetical protein